MTIAGIDIGSRSIELVVLEDERITHRKRVPTTFDPMRQVRTVLEEHVPDLLVATGYGRTLAAEADLGTQVETITEIKAYGLGVAHACPEARTILDIGGQDTKVIAMGENGRVFKFEMNDRCAAGTGKFLEHLATVFQIPIEEFGQYALNGKEGLSINSMCTVFAETEATSLMARGHAPEDIALALHGSIVKRTATMLNRVGLKAPVIFAGGVAHNPCVRTLLSRTIGSDVTIPEYPDMIGALGAALHGVPLSR